MQDHNKTTIVCPQTKRFESIFACALNCQDKCRIYLDNIDYSLLEEYIEAYPDYEIIGVLMAKKTIITDTDNKKRVKKYWVLDNDKKVVEVAESDITTNPKEFLSKEIWDKPPNQYEIVIALKRKK